MGVLVQGARRPRRPRRPRREGLERPPPLAPTEATQWDLLPARPTMRY